MSIPVSGEQHERAVEAIATEFCPREGGACRRCRERACKALAEQGVRLVDLREVVQELREWVKYREDRLPHYGNRTQRADGEAWVLDALDAKLDDLSERRFGGNEGELHKLREAPDDE